MIVFDSHCHPPAQRFADNGVFLFLNAVSEADWPEIKQASQSESVLPFYGVHPWKIWDMKDLPFYLKKFNLWLEENPGTAVGEIGLDKAARNVPYDRQIKLFKGQLELAIAHKRIISFHCVRAWGKFLSMIPEKFERPVMIHGYNGPAEILGDFLDRGFYFSFSRNITDHYNKKGLAAFISVPEDRLLLETEFPQRGEAMLQDKDMYLINLREWYSKAAELRHIDREMFTDTIIRNARIFFENA